jgi:hypothetical protein
MTFNIIHHRGSPQKATTLKNQTVYRQEKLFVEEYEVFINCAPYEEHFIYLNPNTSIGEPSYCCTCGSPAVITPPGPNGMFVCLFHANYGYHTTSVINKKDFEKVAGQKISPIKKGVKWS